MHKNTTVIIAIITLLIGLTLGYGLASSSTVPYTQSEEKMGVHMMPDGTMMQGGHATSTMMANQSMNMTEMMNMMNAELSAKTGDAFDEVFLQEMIVHHQGAVGMAQAALTTAKHQEIKNLAENIITTQNKEITQMQAWLKAWYNK